MIKIIGLIGLSVVITIGTLLYSLYDHNVLIKKLIDSLNVDDMNYIEKLEQYETLLIKNISAINKNETKDIL